MFTQLIVPKKNRKEVMKIAHESISGGHHGSKRTSLWVMGEIYWPGVQSGIVKYY